MSEEKKFDDEQFRERVYGIVSNIPAGFVLTYGTIALLAGRPQNSRMVGKFMSAASEEMPAHRVVNHMGRTASGWAQQRMLLEREGVIFKENGCVNLKNHLWRSV